MISSKEFNSCDSHDLLFDFEGVGEDDPCTVFLFLLDSDNLASLKLAYCLFNGFEGFFRSFPMNYLLKV